MSAITDSFSKLTKAVCDLDLEKSSGRALNNEVKKYCKLLTKAINENSEAFQQTLKAHPEELYAWKNTIAEKTKAIQGEIEDVQGGGFRRLAGGIRRIFFGSATASNLKKINSLLEKVLPEREGFPKKPTHDGHFFLRVSTDTRNAPRLEERAKLRGRKTSSFFMKDNGPKEITHSSVLNIIGHCETSTQEIYADDAYNGKVSIREIVAFLKKNAPELRIKNQDELATGEMLTINLIGCDGANQSGEHPLDVSFAEGLSVALSNAGIPCKIKGVIGTLAVSHNNGIIRKLIKDQKDQQYHVAKPESYITFMSQKDPTTGVITTTKIQNGHPTETIRRGAHEVSWIYNPWRRLVTHPRLVFS